MSDQTSLEQLSSRVPEVPATITVPAYTVHQEAEEAFPLMDYLRVLRKRRWTVISLLFLVVLTIMVVTFRQTPIYRARAVLQIDREAQNILSFKEVLQLDASPYGDDHLETAYRNLQSRTLARRVIDKMKLDQVAEFGAGRASRPFWSGGSAKGAADEARMDPKYNNLIVNFLGRLTIAPVRRSRLVEISFEASDPALAARVVNVLANDFIDQNLEVKLEATEKASEFLRNQLVDLKDKLEKSEEEMQSYARKNSIVFVDDKQSIVSQKLKQLEEEMTRAQAERIQKESLFAQVKGGDLQAVPGILENRIYQDQTMKLADLRREYADMSATFTPEYPKVKRLKSQIEETERNLNRERTAFARRVADDYQAAVYRVKLLKTEVSKQTGEFNDVGEKSIQHSNLKREVDTNKTLYEGLLQRLKEASVSAGLKASNIRVVDQAEIPVRPSRPRKLVNLALALILGLGLGVGMAFFQEYLDNTLKTPDDVQRYLHLPALGVIPAAMAGGRGKLGYGYGYGYGSRKQLAKPGSAKSAITALDSSNGAKNELIGADKNPQLAEAYRSLRTSVLLSTSGRPPKVLLITSGQPGEGKSTTAVNLSMTLVQLGGKVLVIDTDMRRPRVANLLNLKNTPVGLSTYLTGQSTLDEVVIPTRVPNLFAIPCGPIPPNPAELVSSELMRTLLREAPVRFDYVILDSPPVLHVSDARILAAQVEAVVLVAHGGSTPRELVSHAKDHLQQVNGNIIGVVLNNVDFSAVGYDYYYRYYRGYGYGSGTPYGGYGYGSEGSEESRPA